MAPRFVFRNRSAALIVGSLTTLLALTACAQTAPQPSAATPFVEPKETCHAPAALAMAKGKQPTGALQQAALKTAHATSVRVLQHNQPVTREYMFGRLNLVTNSAGVVDSAYCG